MTAITLAGLNNETVTATEDACKALEDAIEGSVLRPGAAGYDESRTLWNAMIDRKPALVVRASSSADVQAAVRFAVDHGVLLAVKGAGHNIAGTAVCEGGLLLDLSGMKRVDVDPDARTARAEPGCTLADFDAATQAHGLATPLGINSTTGLAGLTLGGGFGWLSRLHGLTVDNLQSAEVVLATGERVTASADDNPDLFWAIRGGGGNFGVVTSFEYRLHPVGPEVLAGLVVHPIKNARSVLGKWRTWAVGAPEEISVWTVMRKAPPLPFLDESVHGTEVLVLALVYAGDPVEGEDLLNVVRSWGDAVGEHVGVMPYAGFQQAFDPLLEPGARNYWKSHNFAGLSDEAIDDLLLGVDRLPSPHCEVFIAQMGGATNRVPVAATAYPERAANFVMNVHGRWETQAEDQSGIAWARSLFEDMTAYAMGSAYVNFMPGDEQERVAQAYGANYDRLVALKKRFDPDNVFRGNQNIRP